jgi:predicted dinucleotide-binding enzyme
MSGPPLGSACRVPGIRCDMATGIRKSPFRKRRTAAFVAGNNQGAKKTVMELTREMGYDPVDVGDLKSARYLEPMAIMIIGMAYKLGMGTDIGYRLIRARTEKRCP